MEHHSTEAAGINPQISSVGICRVLSLSQMQYVSLEAAQVKAVVADL